MTRLLKSPIPVLGACLALVFVASSAHAFVLPRVSESSEMVAIRALGGPSTGTACWSNEDFSQEAVIVGRFFGGIIRGTSNIVPETCVGNITVYENPDCTGTILDQATGIGVANCVPTTENIPAPAPPSGLVATALSSTAMKLSWTDNSSDENEFQILRCEPTANPPTCPPNNLVGTAAENATMFTNEDLPPNTSFTYVVCASNAGGRNCSADYTQSTLEEAGMSLTRRTGQNTCWNPDGTPSAVCDTFTDGQDGDLMSGQVWPVPRFEFGAVECGSDPNVFLDHLTKYCFFANMCQPSCQDTANWYPTVCDAVGCDAGGAGLAPVCDDGADASCRSACNLGDGSVSGDWYVANATVAASLIDYSMVGSILFPSIPFELTEKLDALGALACWDQEFWTATSANAGNPLAAADEAYTVDWSSANATGVLRILDKDANNLRGLLAKKSTLLP